MLFRSQAADGVNALAQKNAAQAQAQQQGLADKQSKQSELSKQSAVTKQNFDQSGAKAGQGQGLVGGFIGKFMSLMSMIPSRLMGDSGEGSSGAKKLQSGVDGAGKGSAAGQQAVQQAQAAGSQFSADTANANTQAQEVGSQMGTLTGQVQTDKAAALQGQADLQSAEGEIDTKIDSMEADQGRLAAEHDGWVATMLNWTTSHEALRKKGMGELEGIVTLVDTKS